MKEKTGIIEYDPALFRSKESDKLLSTLLDNETILELSRTTGNGFVDTKMKIAGPLRDFLIELLTRLRVRDDVFIPGDGRVPDGITLVEASTQSHESSHS